MVPPALAEYLTTAGRQLPEPVVGDMLVDTGATATSIALDVAQELGLQQTRIGKTYGAGGLHQNPVFSGQLIMEIRDGGNSTRLTMVREVMGIPHLNEPYREIGVLDGTGRPVRLIGLLGRDFLRHVTMTYRGSSAEVEFVLDFGSLQAK